MKRFFQMMLLAALSSALLSGCNSMARSVASVEAPLSEQERQGKRVKILKMQNDTMAQLYKEKPEAQEAVEKAVGYGVFEAQQVNALLVLGSFGDGLMVDNANGKQTFMKMDRLGTGPGVGYKAYRQVVVFKNRALYDQFISVGADVNASADATAKVGDKGGSVVDNTTSFDPMVSVYQFTDEGILLQANWGGVVYLPDPQLNEEK